MRLMTRLCRHCRAEFSVWGPGSRRRYCGLCGVKRIRAGAEAGNLRRGVTMNDEGLRYCPTPEEIAAMCLEIQTRWSDAERASRAKWANAGEATTIYRY